MIEKSLKNVLENYDEFADAWSIRFLKLRISPSPVQYLHENETIGNKISKNFRNYVCIFTQFHENIFLKIWRGNVRGIRLICGWPKIYYWFESSASDKFCKIL